MFTLSSSKNVNEKCDVSGAKVKYKHVYVYMFVPFNSDHFLYFELSEKILNKLQSKVLLSQLIFLNFVFFL